MGKRLAGPVPIRPIVQGLERPLAITRTGMGFPRFISNAATVRVPRPHERSRQLTRSMAPPPMPPSSGRLYWCPRPGTSIRTRPPERGLDGPIHCWTVHCPKMPSSVNTEMGPTTYATDCEYYHQDGSTPGSRSPGSSCAGVWQSRWARGVSGSRPGYLAAHKLHMAISNRSVSSSERENLCTR